MEDIRSVYQYLEKANRSRCLICMSFIVCLFCMSSFFIVFYVFYYLLLYVLFIDTGSHESIPTLSGELQQQKVHLQQPGAAHQKPWEIDVPVNVALNCSRVNCFVSVTKKLQTLGKRMTVDNCTKAMAGAKLTCKQKWACSGLTHFTSGDDLLRRKYLL